VRKYAERDRQTDVGKITQFKCKESNTKFKWKELKERKTNINKWYKLLLQKEIIFICVIF